MNYKIVSIKNGGMRPEQPCKRADCVFPRPAVHFAIDGAHIVAAWSWVDLAVDHKPDRLRITIEPSLLLIRISCN